MDELDRKFNSSKLSERVRAIVILLFAIVIAYKMIATPLSLTMDFYALLSLLLALFSVGLSALFYFKATDSSNAFYDNTYKFTKDIAELLARIESGFGERLRHLDESYTRIQDRVYSQPSKEDIEETQKQVQKEEENLNAKLEERDKLIEELVQKSKLDGKEKQNFLDQLRAREKELNRLQLDLARLNDQASDMTEENLGNNRVRSLLPRVRGYVITNVINQIPFSALRTGNIKKLKEVWEELEPALSPAFLRDFQILGFLDSKDKSLTREGVTFLRKVYSTRNIEEDPIHIG